jgi:tRNA-dihydrouridine synthase B
MIEIDKNSDGFKIDEYLKKNPFVLGPMAGVTDSVFRKLCKDYQCGILFSEMISAKGLFYKDKKTEILLRSTESERPLAYQIFGSEPDVMVHAAILLSDKENDIIDINMGCPVAKVVKNGDGSALLRQPRLVEKIVKSVVAVSKKPVSVKIRLGWDDKTINHLEIAKIIEASGASLLTVHGRTREQFYSGLADWESIRQVKESVKIPVIGSGDVFSAYDAIEMLKRTGCDGVMIARGALGQPWIFEEALHLLKELDYQDPDIPTRIKLIKKHISLLIKDKGEYVTIREMRKHMGWYFKGLHGAADIRRRVNTINNIEEMILLLDNYLIKQEHGEFIQ